MQLPKPPIRHGRIVFAWIEYVVNWLSQIRASDVVGYGGDVPSKTMRLIQKKLDELSGREDG